MLDAKIRISNLATIHPSVQMGMDGFSFTRNIRGELVPNQHPCGINIQDYVDIGAGVCIDRGSWRDTFIGEGTKIDNLVHIAHNVVIGKHCLIAPSVTFGGSVTVGDYTDIWMDSIIHQRTNIGKNCIIGAGSYIRHDVPDKCCAYIYKGRQVNKRLDEVKYPKKVFA